MKKPRQVLASLLAVGLTFLCAGQAWGQVIPELNFTSKQDVENLVLSCAQGGYLRLKDVARVIPAVGPVEIAREDQVKEVIVRGDASGVSVGQALSELKGAMGKLTMPVGYEVSYGGQAQMMAEMQRSVMLILIFALFFAFVVLAVQFNSLKLPALILGSVPFCLAGVFLPIKETPSWFGAECLPSRLFRFIRIYQVDRHRRSANDLLSHAAEDRAFLIDVIMAAAMGGDDQQIGIFGLIALSISAAASPCTSLISRLGQAFSSVSQIVFILSLARFNSQSWKCFR
jgi:hypothetical protein